MQMYKKSLMSAPKAMGEKLEKRTSLFDEKNI